MSSKKRIYLSAAQKREICEAKKSDPTINNQEFAKKYNIGKSTITKILNEKDRWLATTTVVIQKILNKLG